jgi:RluA family pseudouridine synthase
MSLPIIYEDNYMVVVNKPAGIQVESDSFGNPSLENEVQQYLYESYPWKKQLRVGVVHRLDRPVSGVIIMALTPSSLKNLRAQFENNQIEKNYLALVEGEPAPVEGQLVHWLRKHDKNHKALVVKPHSILAKEAILNYELLSSSRGFSILRIVLQTGRYHQIRAQLAASGFPVAGDDKYGSGYKTADKSVLLHSWSLKLHHPKTNEALFFKADPPATDEWQIFNIYLRIR